MAVEQGAIVAITDGGGRGAVAVDEFLKSPHVNQVLVFPGNAMMAEGREDRVKVFPKIKTSDVHQIMQVCRELGATHIDPIQDNAVQAGITEVAQLHRIKSMGPTSSASRIEWDKEYARELGRQIGILQPKYEAFSTLSDAETWLDTQPEAMYFVKATGLAEGKGSIGTKSRQEVVDAIKRLKTEYPNAAERFLIESALEGEEVSVFAVSDGTRSRVVGYAQDHKREYDGDRGENTGGMGAVSNPLVMADKTMQHYVGQDINDMVRLQERLGSPYKGWVFEGVMLVPQNDKVYPHLIEFNARPGDPEHQVIAPGLVDDYFEVEDSIASGNINRLELKHDGKVRVVVAIASLGYPRNYDAVRNREIRSIPELKKMEDIHIYGAGVKMEEGKYYAAGGRQYYVMAEGENILDAKEKLNPALEVISTWDSDVSRFRNDIGWRDVDRLRHKNT